MKKIVVIGLSGKSIFLSCDHFNSLGETVKAKDMFIEPGGKGYNQALALGKIGANVSFITVFGNDDYANECIKVLEENNVKVFPIYKDDLTSLATIITNKEGENNVIVYSGASEKVTYFDIMKYQNIIENCDILLLQLEYPFEVIKDVIEFAYKKEIKVVLNPAPYRVLDDELLRKIYLITPNEYELMQMAECTDPYQALSKLAANIIVCTRGKDRILIKASDKRYSVEPMIVDKKEVIDTTGAGDIFNAFLVYSLNDDIIKAVRFASVAASLSVKKKGVVESIPALKEVKDNMEEI